MYDALARVRGVGQVVDFGARDYGMRIWLDPGKDGALGRHHRGHQQHHQRTERRRAGRRRRRRTRAARAADDVRRHGEGPAVARRRNIAQSWYEGGPNGAIVHLQDIARIELAATDYSRSTRLNGKPVACIGVYQLPDANALDVARGVRATLERWRRAFRRASIIRFRSTPRCSCPSRCTGSRDHAGEGRRAGAAGGVYIPGELARDVDSDARGAGVADRCLQRLRRPRFLAQHPDLFALVLAIGLVVDDAIVVVEAVTEIMDGRKGSTARGHQGGHGGRVEPVIAIALVLMSVFVPVSFLGGLTGPVLPAVRADAVGLGAISRSSR